MRRAALFVVLLSGCALSGCALSGCGGSAAPQAGGAQTPATKEAPPPELAPTTKKSETEGASTMVDVPSAERAFDDASKAFAASGSDCVSMCKALQSMARATERLCELAGTGPDAPRCEDAKSKLESARAKVKATCGGACE